MNTSEAVSISGYELYIYDEDDTYETHKERAREQRYCTGDNGAKRIGELENRFLN
jgi:hypothetical protein